MDTRPVSLATREPKVQPKGRPDGNARDAAFGHRGAMGSLAQMSSDVLMTRFINNF